MKIATDRVFVLVRVTGEYSDRRECLLFAVTDEDRAKQMVLDAAEEWRCANAIHPTPDWPDANAEDAAYDTFREKVAARNASFKSLLTVDPDAAPEGEWASTEEPYYHYDPILVLSS